MSRNVVFKLVTVALIVAIQAWSVPVKAEAKAVLEGTIVAAEAQAPLAGVKLYAGDPKTGQIYTSTVTGADGSFVVTDLPSAAYELAVESNGGLYLVPTPVQLAPGETQQVTVAVNGDSAPDPETAKKKKKKGAAGIWDNPLTAALIVIGAAFIVGILIDDATDDGQPASNPMPGGGN